MFRTHPEKIKKTAGFLELTEAIELVSTLLCIRLEIIHEN